MQTSELIFEIEKAISYQKEKLLLIGQKKVQPFTEEELNQPFDWPALAKDEEFLYEEGVYHGQLGMLSLVRSLLKEAPVG
ncbi:MAG: hypothetical protein ACOYL1_00225 [Chlamydiia bacterium]|jgi:hypothetical protein|nr:hypothetical protein [Chlamydiota bacterium]